MSGSAAYMDGLRALVRKTADLEAAAAGADWEQTLRLLEERQGLMDQFGPAIPADLTAEERRQAHRMLEDLVRRDRALQMRLEAARSGIRGELEHNHLARATVSAYRRSSRTVTPGMEARFVDKQR